MPQKFLCPFFLAGIAAVGQQNAPGFTYAGDKFVETVYLGPNNLQLFSTDPNGGNAQPFGRLLPTGGGEIAVAGSLARTGAVTLLATTGDDTEGMDVIPLSAAAWGSFAAIAGARRFRPRRPRSGTLSHFAIWRRRSPRVARRDGF